MWSECSAYNNKMFVKKVNVYKGKQYSNIKHLPYGLIFVIKKEKGIEL